MRSRVFPAATQAAFTGDAGWHARARCRGESTETFYPPDHARGGTRRLSERRAKQICEDCPVLVQCRRYAVDAQEPHGIWGGTTPEERSTLARGGRLTNARDALR